MAWQFTPYAIPMALSTVVSALLAVSVVRATRDDGAAPTAVVFSWAAVSAAVWMGFSTLKLLQTDPALKLVFYRLLHLGAAALPPLLFLFVLAYTDRRRWLRRRVVLALFALPAVFVGLLLVDPGEATVSVIEVVGRELVVIRVTDGPEALPFRLFSVLLVFASLALVVYEAARVGRSYYPQATLLALGSVAPIPVVALVAAGVPPFDTGVNLVPTSGALSVGAFAVAVYRYKLFDVPPLAYATAMRYSPDGMLVLDPEERIVHANPSGHAVLDRVGADLGAPMSAVVPGFDPATDAGEVVEVGGDGDTGSLARVLVEGLARGERQVGWTVVLRDVTEQQRQQRTLERQAAQLDAFASTVSHDLRNPLTVARGYTEIAREGVDPGDESAVDAFERVEAAHDRMERIISDVLTLSKQGKRIDTPVAVSLPAVAADAWENVDRASATLTADESRTVMADRGMLQHVFENLFRNAIEHGGTDVRLRVGTLPDGFFVEDDGPGIPDGQRESVLEPGFTTTEGGTGYGLRIVQSVVDAHGWRLCVAEGSEGGARFEVVGVESAGAGDPQE